MRRERFLLLTADNRVGTVGNFKIDLNETSIGSTFPVFGVELAKARLNPAYLTDGLDNLQAWMQRMAEKPGIRRACEVPEGAKSAAELKKGGASITTT